MKPSQAMKFSTPPLAALALAGLVLASAPCRAVRPYQPAATDPLLEPWRWRTFAELKGLGLRCLVEARDGALWFGVDEGVQRYDGIKWRTYSSAADGPYGAPVNVLFAARDGSVYAGSDKGISRYSGQTWTRVFPPEGDLPWPIDRIRQAADGSIWAATAWGALHLRDDGARLYTAQDMATVLRQWAPYVDLAMVPSDAVPLRPWGTGVGVKVIKGAFLGAPRGAVPMTIWAVDPDGPAAAAGLRVGDGIVAADGSLPLLPHFALDGPEGTSVTLQILRPGRSDSFSVELTRRYLEGGVRHFSLSDLLEDERGGWWFGLSWGGELVYCAGDPERAAWQLHAAADGLIPGDRPRIYQTSDNAVWTVSIDPVKGINRFRDGRWTHFDADESAGTNIHLDLLETPDGTLWIGGFPGYLHAFKDGTWRVYGSVEVPLPQARIANLVRTADGALWIAGLGQEAVRLDYGVDRWATWEGLDYQCDDDGALWFIADSDSAAVRFDGENWIRYGAEDGLMQYARVLIATRGGAIWAAGKDQGQAATSRFSAGQWSTRTHAQLAYDIDYNALFEADDGALWFGAGSVAPGHEGGVLRFADGAWTHYAGHESLLFVYAIAQTPGGALWFGGPLHRFKQGRWTPVDAPRALTSWVHDMCTTAAGDLWLGTRSYGVYRFDGQTWRQYSVRDGLADNQVNAILPAADGGVWAATPRGISRFDGQSWLTHALPPQIDLKNRRGGLRSGRDGALWINAGKRAIRYRPDTWSPDTEMGLSLDEVSQPGNTTLNWQGADPWKATRQSDLRYAWRLNGGAWSPFAAPQNHLFLELPDGDYLFEVKARDTDFNEDPTPAALRFTVLPPISKQPWFIGLLAILLGAIAFQTARVVRRGRGLRTSNAALRQANEQLHREIGERERLDEQLRQLRYLDRLRSALEGVRTTDEVMRRAGQALMEVLAVTPASGVHLECNGRSWRFGVETGRHYQCALGWDERERGRLHLFCDVALSEAQQRALLDETANHISRVLHAQELTAQLLQSGRLVSLGQMAAGVAHELNQPLAVISTLAGEAHLRLTQDQEISTARQEEVALDLLAMVKRMADTISHLRIFSRDTTDEPGTLFSLDEVVRSSLKMIGAQLKSSGIALEVELAAGLLPAHGHANQLEQVVLNLLANARDALDEGDRLGEKHLYLRTLQSDGELHIEIADNGPGIAEEHLARLFEPFFTTKSADRGTGLGLSISYAIVQDHGGRITCESRPGEGATFRVVLPVAGEH